MLMVLDGKNKTGFIDGSMSVSPTISKSILYFKTARIAWTVLRQRFSQGDYFKIADLQEQIFGFKQGSQSVTKYFTELVTLYDELRNFRPIPDCACSPICSCSLAKIRLYQEQDSVIRFLRGLNDNFSSPRSQVMLLEPLPNLNKVFAMMIQQERDVAKQSIGEAHSHAFLARTDGSHAGNSQALAARPSTFKKQGKRPVCSYCGFVGHTVEVCYKKNGYPPGYQHRPRVPRANAVTTDAAALDTSEPTSATVQVSQADWTTFQQQYQRMAAAFQPSPSPAAHHTAAAVHTKRFEVPEQAPTHVLKSPVHQVAVVSSDEASKRGKTAVQTSFDPTGPSSSGNPSFPRYTNWVLDTGASDHIVCDFRLLTSHRRVSNTVVHLPNGDSALVSHIGQVVFSENLVLYNVLLVPSFSFNLVSISQLAKYEGLSVFFHNNLCLIQAFPSLRMIGTAELHQGLYLLHSASHSAQVQSLLQLQNSSSLLYNASTACNDNIKIHECNSAVQSTHECHSAVQSTHECNSTMQSTHECNGAVQSKHKYISVNNVDPVDLGFVPTFSHINIVRSHPFSDATYSTEIHNIDTWHYRLGHMGANSMRQVLKSDNAIHSKTNFHCKICPCAKQKRLAFSPSLTTYTKPFQLVCMDIWGPTSTPSISGCLYFLTIIDVFSRFTWVFPLKLKSEVRPLVIKFFAYVKTQFEASIQILRTDNGKEFLLPEFYGGQGTIHQTTCVQTSQQNGIVERKHQHILAISRALTFQSFLPLSFWSYAVIHAIHLINRTPTPILEGGTPYERLYGSPPDYSHLKIFGSLCYSSTLAHPRSKLSPRALPCIFLGYPANKKAYLLMSLTNNEIIISRDVIFYENIFPFYSKDKPINSSPIPLPDYIGPLDDLSTSLPPIILSPSPSSLHVSPSSSETSLSSGTSPSRETSTLHHNSTIPINDISLHHNILPTTLMDSVPHSLPVRRSTRTSTKPHYLKDYKCNMVSQTQVRYPIEDILTYQRLSEKHRHYVFSISSEREPTTYLQASKSENWIKAIQFELNSLEKTKTWVLSDLPANKKPIGCKWVFRIKYKQDGTIDKYKARLVAKGYTQTHGIDYMDTFSPVVKMTTVRTLLAIAAIQNWHLEQLDVNTAFLHGDLDEEVYMVLPPGLPVSSSTNQQVCKLTKSLYGLKQASRQWHAKLSDTLITLGYIQSKSDYSLFTKNNTDGFTALLVYVDDIILAGSNIDEISRVKRHLDITFTIKDLGPLKYFLGMEVSRSSSGIHLCQRKYALDLLTDTGFLASKPASTPAIPGIHHTSLGTSLLLDDTSHYRRLIGRLQYLCTTRPDICYTVNQLSQFVSSPTTIHDQATHRLLRYLKGSPAHGLHFSRTSSLRISAFSDSDWAGCPDSRRSVTGFCTFLGDSLISWKSKKQPTVSRSSAEAEYRALASTASELQWLHGLLSHFPIQFPQPYALYCDSLSAVKMTENPVQHERTKHIELDCHFIREKVLDGLIKVYHISTHNQLADPLTKSLQVNQFTHLISKLHLDTIHA
ncbi:Retrovirus-related Pol polyprotein from transposon TNT 1-94 [Linum perenne]